MKIEGDSFNTQEEEEAVEVEEDEHEHEHEHEHGQEAVFSRESITKEDPPNVHHAQHRPKRRFDECVASVHP